MPTFTTLLATAAVSCTVLLCAVLSGCGGARAPWSRGAGQAAKASAHGRPDGDGDGDGNRDDRDIRYYGHAATMVASATIGGLVRRYYMAAMRGDGAEACSLIVAALAEGLAIGSGENPPASRLEREKACAVAVGKLFAAQRSQADFHTGGIEVEGVRVDGPRALVLIRLRTSEERYMPVSFEGGAWRIATLFDNGMI